jgi:hypothetical protein
MTNIHEELKSRAKILEIIDRRRLDSGDPTLGSAIERAIIDHCLVELEREANTPLVALAKRRA